MNGGKLTFYMGNKAKKINRAFILGMREIKEAVSKVRQPLFLNFYDIRIFLFLNFKK